MLPKSLDSFWDHSIELGKLLETTCIKRCFLADSEMHPSYSGRDTLESQICSELDYLWEGIPDDMNYTCGQIADICRFIDFRRKYILFDEGILSAMLAPEVSMDTKRELMKRGFSIREVFDLLKRVRTDWSGRYTGNGFKEMIDKL